MPIEMYDLVGRDDARFSPYCWRIRMAMAHKGLDFETVPRGFTEIPHMLEGDYNTVPVINDNGKLVKDSWDIAEYLDETYPDKPELFGSEEAKALCRFVQAWANTTVIPALATLIVKDIHDNARDVDQAYFRESREKRFGRTLEEVQAGREGRVDSARSVFTPMRLTLASQPFLGGKAPNYADYIVFGTLQWPRIGSPFRILSDEDPVNEWMTRCLDLHGGIARTVPAAT